MIYEPDFSLTTNSFSKSFIDILNPSVKTIRGQDIRRTQA
jgi:hypothetical protein